MLEWNQQLLISFSIMSDQTQVREHFEHEENEENEENKNLLEKKVFDMSKLL